MRCPNCNCYLEGSESRCPDCGARIRKPFYETIWFAVAAVVLTMVIGFVMMDRSSEEFVWDNVEMNALLPEPPVGTGHTWMNTSSCLWLELTHITESDYRQYMHACRDAGISLEADEWGYEKDASYNAFNEDGYELRLSYTGNSNELEISLYAPEELEELTWPSNGLGSMLPAPASTLGKVMQDSSGRFDALVGQTTKDAFMQYARVCRESGFDQVEAQSDDWFYAKNADGLELTASYEGGQVMSVRLIDPDPDPDIEFNE